MLDDAEIENRFNHHPPKSEVATDLHYIVRTALKNVACDWNDLLPESREKAVAITKLEEAMFWANAAIARNY